MYPLVLTTTRLVMVLLALTNLSQVLSAQERDADREHAVGRNDRSTIAQRTGHLRQRVNGNALVRTHCTSQDHEVEVEEATEIVDVRGCNLTVRTRKVTTSGSDRRELEFTLDANLAELTTPAAVQPQIFSQCKSLDGPLLKVMSRTEPGKSFHAVSRSVFPDTVENAESLQRSDLSFFFHDEAKAKKAARALDQAVRRCGGKEWPDEDSLP